MQDRVIVAGVPVDPLTLGEAAVRAKGFLTDGRQHLVVTPNPEMAVMAARDPSFREVLGSADLALADGFGLRIAAFIEGKHIPETIQGVTFSLTLAEIAEQKNYSVYLLGGKTLVAEKAAVNLKKSFSGLRVVGAESGGTITWDHGAWHQGDRLLERIRYAKPDILLVALGHGKQERWIRDHLRELPSVRVAIGVGGTLDFLGGTVHRAPGPFRLLHLEWLWRLLVQPWRAARIFDATFVFLVMVLKNRKKRVS